MLQLEKLDALFQLLKEMTLHVRKKTVPSFSQGMQSLGKWLLWAYVITMALMAIVALYYRFVGGNPTHGIPELVNLLFLVGLAIAMLYMITVIIDVAYMTYRLRHDRFTTVLAPLENDLRNDADYLIRLQAFDKSTLAYGLVQYRHYYDISDGRLAMLAGDIRKIGLFPALAATVAFAANLRKDDVSNPFLWAPVVLAGCFYLVSFVLIGSRERAGQVIALLEYAISQADEPPKVASSVPADAASSQHVADAPDSK